MADSAGQAVSSVLHANADEKTDLDFKLDSIEHDNSASSLAGVKTGVKNRVAIRDASSPFLMDEDEEQDMLFRRGSRRPDEDDEQDGREAETPGASPPANTADNERPLGGNGVARNLPHRCSRTTNSTIRHGQLRPCHLWMVKPSYAEMLQGCK
jgi:hypothetical protein